MKNEIEKIIVNHIDRKISLGEATTQILRLFAVSERNVQLVCGTDIKSCVFYDKGKCKNNDYCKDQVEQTNCN
jgi:hypothetical protein